jgi:hypothetical protein
MTTAKTLSQIFEEFLAEQKARVSQKTFMKYQSVIGLYKSYLESYWPGHDHAELAAQRLTRVRRAKRSRPLRLPRRDSSW